MTAKTVARRALWPATFLLLLVLAGLACSLPGRGPYNETFDSTGSWGTGSDLNVEGSVTNGVYDFLVKRDVGLFWATAGESQRNGVYEVEATQVAGPLDNGYGMLFRFDSDTDSFYLFEISGDGYTWIGRCTNGCSDEAVALVGNDWVATPAVKTGLNDTNLLRVEAEDANMTFFVNGQEVGRFTDSTLTQGDIGVMIETLGEGGVRVEFDNFSVTPLDN